jgi:hypothetical protein
MSKAIRTSVLVLLLTSSAQAGWMGNDSPAPPPSQPAPAVQGPTTDGIMQTPLTTDGDMQNDAGITFMEVVLNLLALS